MTLRVVVVDDNELLRAGLITVLTSDPDLLVVAEAASGPAGVTLALQHRPDIVLMDVEMPGGDGIAATADLVRQVPAVRVLILTMFDLDDYVLEALRAGASGYLLKTTPPAQLLDAVKACAQGDTALGPTVVKRLVDSYTMRAPHQPVAGIEQLTARECDVLESMAQGLSNSEIARELYLAETTVKTHVARILTKLGVRDRVQAVVVAHRSGLAS